MSLKSLGFQDDRPHYEVMERDDGTFMVWDNQKDCLASEQMCESRENAEALMAGILWWRKP